MGYRTTVLTLSHTGRAAADRGRRLDADGDPLSGELPRDCRWRSIEASGDEALRDEGLVKAEGEVADAFTSTVGRLVAHDTSLLNTLLAWPVTGTIWARVPTSSTSTCTTLPPPLSVSVSGLLLLSLSCSCLALAGGVASGG